MNKLAYLECPTGIAGDMCLGALVDAGVPLDYLRAKLDQLNISQEYRLRAEQVQRNGQQATKVQVDCLDSNGNILAENIPDPSHHHHHHEALPHRHLPDIEQLIQSAKLPPQAEAWSLQVFRQLAAAESAVHGIPPEQVHFHEVGATDAIVDIVGTCLGLDWLGITQLYCSALPTGGGSVRAAHGLLPVPVPAVLKLWESRQVPVYSNGIDRELVTPTGAAIAVTLATQFGFPPAMTIERIGLGAGSRDLPIPNILRLWIGAATEIKEKGKSELLAADCLTDLTDDLSVRLRTDLTSPPSVNLSAKSATKSVANFPQSPELETISVLETQIDDLNPQAIGYVFDRLFEVGAVDVFTQPIGMKKSRPGILLTVICHPEQLTVCEAVLFQETSTLGIRRLTQQRAILQREIQLVQTKYGNVRVKIAWSGQTENRKIVNVQPEYEDCADLARQYNLPWREVHDSVLHSWHRPHG